MEIPMGKMERMAPKRGEKERSEQRGKADTNHPTVEKFLEQAFRLPLQPTDGGYGISVKGSRGDSFPSHR